jgi:hypothetical protein
MSVNENNIDMKELKKGIQMILTAFNEQKEQYIKIINSLKERILSLEEQVNKLKEENILYQNKLYTLQKNIKCISKTIYQLREDEESAEEKNISDFDKSEKTNSEDTEKKILMKEKDKIDDFYKKYNLNKLELTKIKKINNKNQEENNFLLEDNNNFRRDDDIKIKKKENSYMKNVYNNLNNKKNQSKKDSKSKINSIINDDLSINNKFFENKSDKEIKESFFDINDNINQDK